MKTWKWTSACRLQWGSNCFYLCFIPRRDVLALPWGPIDSLLGYCFSERNLSLQFWAGNPPFLNPIFFLFTGWVGRGWVGMIYHLQFSLYFVRIHIMYISTYICNQKYVTKALICLKIWCQVEKIRNLFCNIKFEFVVWFSQIVCFLRKHFFC